jgi:hypothetical protein
MANPNIVSVATINGNTAYANVTTVMTNLVTNSAASGKIFKVNALYLTNVTGGTVAFANVDIVRTSASYKLINSMDLPYKATIDAISKSIYLLKKSKRSDQIPIIGLKKIKIKINQGHGKHSLILILRHTAIS